MGDVLSFKIPTFVDIITFLIRFSITVFAIIVTTRVIRALIKRKYITVSIKRNFTIAMILPILPLFYVFFVIALSIFSFVQSGFKVESFGELSSLFIMAAIALGLGIFIFLLLALFDLLVVHKIGGWLGIILLIVLLYDLANPRRSYDQKIDYDRKRLEITKCLCVGIPFTTTTFDNLLQETICFGKVVSCKTEYDNSYCRFHYEGQVETQIRNSSMSHLNPDIAASYVQGFPYTVSVVSVEPINKEFSRITYQTERVHVNELIDYLEALDFFGYAYKREINPCDLTPISDSLY